MTRPNRRRGAMARLMTGVVVAVTAIAMLLPAPALGIAQILDQKDRPSSVDTRTGTVPPTAAQRSRVSGLGARATWNRFGTPSSLIRYGGYLATGVQGADAATAARSWIQSNRSLYRLASTDAAILELVNDQRMARSNSHAVLFRQRFGSLPAGKDGIITVGIVGTAGSGWKVAYASSTSAGTQAAPEAATLTPQQAWSSAAIDVGRAVVPADIQNSITEGSWTVFPVRGFTQLQRARLVAVPFPGHGVRAAYESNVVDFGGTKTLGVTSFVDARSGAVIARVDRVQNYADHHEDTSAARTLDTNGTTPFTGEYVNEGCGPDHSFTVDASTKSIVVVASAVLPQNDIVLKLWRDPNGARILLASGDTGTSPETVRYAPSTGVPAGEYATAVCDFVGSAAEDVQSPPYTYVGSVVTSDEAVSANAYPPAWTYFQSNPKLNLASDDVRATRCWEKKIAGVTVPGCTPGWPALRNLASRAPWDVIEQNIGQPSYTTSGNNANTQEGWIDPPTVIAGNIGPGLYGQRGTDANRNYDFPWTNVWHTSGCDPANLVPGGNDIFATVTDLFANHNRMHDWSYFLGFTESTYNLQISNYGVRSEGQGDPEVGTTQAGAIDGSYPFYGGRDNANQLTLQDGIPGVTNQYLFQPIGGAFYAPCADGDMDLTIVGHEYTHAISNRMVGGPDGGLDTNEGGAMGESWSDLNAVEMQLEHGYFLPGQDPWSVGAYATGNKERAIRDFNLARNPLNYSNQGFDTPNFEVHADGEIWNAVNYDIRQALVQKYDAQYDADDQALQRRCAEGQGNQSPLPVELCPGNRRWIQIVFDAWLLMQSDVDFLGARDAYLAADVMRFDGANQKELWKAFARRGMGIGAQPAPGGAIEEEDVVNVPSFKSPVHVNGLVTFDVRSLETGAKVAKAKVLVGRFEQRTSPIADTDASTATYTDKAEMVPGTYDFIVQAPGYGEVRFSRSIYNGNTNFRVSMPTNWASKTQGATATADANGEGATRLIDDTENTNWHAFNAVSADGSSVVVRLAKKKIVGLVRVSAMLGIDAGGPNDPGIQNRFTALRQFEVWTCTESATNPDCINPLGFTKIYTSPADAFPSVAPRPVAPDLNLREFDVPDTLATHVRFVALHNQCTGNATFQTGFTENDPTSGTDCRVGNPPATPVSGVPQRDTDVRAAELQVISSKATLAGSGDPLVTVTVSGPATATAASDITATVGYTNLGPEPASASVLRYTLPDGVAFLSATGGGRYSAIDRRVTWDLGTVPVTFSDKVSVTLRVPGSVSPGSVLIGRADYTAVKTVANPAFGATIVVE